MNKWWVRLMFGILIWLVYYLLTIFFDYTALPILPIIAVSYLLFTNQLYILPLLVASILTDWSNFEFQPIFTITTLIIWPIFKQINNLVKRFDELWFRLMAGIILNLLWLGILEFMVWQLNNQLNPFKSQFYFGWVLLVIMGNLILGFGFKYLSANKKK